MPTIALVAAGGRLGQSLGKIFGGHGFYVALIARSRSICYGAITATRAVLPAMLAAGTGTVLYTTGGSSVTPAQVFVSAGMVGVALRKWAGPSTTYWPTVGSTSAASRSACGSPARRAPRRRRTQGTRRHRTPPHRSRALGSPHLRVIVSYPDSGSRMTTAAAIRIPDCHVLKDALHGPDSRA
jgi:hypothetical protein